MKDSADKQTRDLLDDKPRRGRPVTGQAKSQAQVQREYRARQKALKRELAPFVLELVQPCLRCLELGLAVDGPHDAHVCASQRDALLRLRRALIGTSGPGQVKCRRTGSSPGRSIQASNGAPGGAHT